MKEFEHVRSELKLLDDKNKVVDDKLETRYHEINKKINTINDKIKAGDLMRASQQNSINLFSSEVKNILKIVTESKDKIN